MLEFDASSIIYAWDNYPIKQFPGLWEWIGREIQIEEFAITDIALSEIGDNSPECQEWLKLVGIMRLPITQPILDQALEIKTLLQIEEDQYHSKGVGENDILIISCAKINRATLVSDEERQNNLPDILSKMKIPAVCKLKEVDVECIDFVTLMKKSEEVF